MLAVRAAALAARTVLSNQGPHRDAIEVVEGHTRRDLATDTRDYAFVVSLVNRSSAERRFNEPTLRVTYRTRANFLGAVDLASADAFTVAAGQSAQATLRFSTSNVIPRHCRIDAYTLHFIDESGARIGVDASLPAVLQADSDGTGPATWGWD